MAHESQNIVELAWERRAELTPTNAPDVRNAVERVIADLNHGRVRVAQQ